MPRRSASLKRNLLQRKGLRRSRPPSGHAVRSHAERGNEINEKRHGRPLLANRGESEDEGTRTPNHRIDSPGL